jgi:hypothetical protein
MLDSRCSRYPATSCENGGWLSKNMSHTNRLQFRTKSAQSGGLETNGRRERISDLGRCIAMRRLVGEARVYWASMRARKPAENVGRRTSGGASGIRTLGTIFSAADSKCACSDREGGPTESNRDRGSQTSRSGPRALPRHTVAFLLGRSLRE